MAKEKPKTKICKHCKTEIPYDARVCPQCRKKQKGGILKWILIIVIVLVVVGAAAGGSEDSDSASDSNPKKVNDSSGNNSEKEESGTETGNDSKTQGEGKDGETSADGPKNEFNVGDVVETSDLKISFTNAEEYTSDNEFMQPKDGNVYYKMDFEFENISDSDQYVSSFDFKCYADGYDMEQAYMDGLDLDATLSPGKKTKGSVFFEVPSDSEEMTLEYETNFWTEDKVVFIVK